MGKPLCQKCNKKCSGEALKVHDKYFHVDCFKCKECKCSLAQGGFFAKDGEYFCTNDYQKLFGEKCPICGDYVEGEVVSTLGNTYHQKCFSCARCRQPFPTGERVTFTGKEYLCQKCIYIPVVSSQSPELQSPNYELMKCSGCKEELKEGQALIALDKQWHIWCFKCHACNAVLHGEYLGKDGLPYCEKDYQQLFGVRCAHCERFISGKVLRAGENHHFHPTCARCSKCGDPFGDGEEMFLQGTAIWHPRCGPGPNGTAHHNGQVYEGNGHSDGYHSEYIGPHPVVVSPGLYRERDYQESPPLHYPDVDITRIYTCSYLTAEPTQGYLKRPLDPRPPKSPQFHRPQDKGHKFSINKPGFQKPGMKVLVESIQSTTPRPRSPHMNNEEPIELAHYPDARPPKPNELPKIERDDFPAPPFPYTDPERRRRWSDSYKGIPLSDDEDEENAEDNKVKKEEEELSKISSGIGKVFLQDIKEQEKRRQWKLRHLDPRNASRVPSASKEPPAKLRYESSINASPSRNLERPKPWEEDELDRSSSCRGSFGRSAGHTPTYNVVSSLRNVPRPGYGLATPRSATFSYSGRPTANNIGGISGEYIYDDFNKVHSADLSSGKSDVSASSLTENDRNMLNHDLRSATTYSGLRSASYSPHFRRSLPNMHHMSSEPPKIYPIHLLQTENYRLPSDVDRCHLERHLSNEDFEAVFRMGRSEFYRLPEWRRNDMKKRAKLF
ncbi:hypothetical protein CHUAL_014211 [Chamberlinius hualienensis]